MKTRSRDRRAPGALVKAALFVGSLQAGATALECKIVSDSPSWVNGAAAFSLSCDAPVTAPVSWDFGDGASRPYAANQTAVSHAYAAIGDYTVFARVQGQSFPLTRLHTVLHPVTPRRPTQSATMAYDAARGRVWNVNADNNSVSVVDARALARVREIPVGRNPRTLALDTLGRIWVSNQDDATLSVIDGGSMAVLHTVLLPHASRPYGVVFAPGGRVGYVTLEAKGKLLRFDATTRAVTGTLDLFRTPRAIAVAHDGARVLVTRFLSPKGHGEVADVSASAWSLSRIVRLEYENRPDGEDNGSGVPNALSSVTISPDGRKAWVTFKKDNVGRGLFVNPSLPAPTFESTVRTGVAKIDLASGKEDSAARIDLNNRSRAVATAFDAKGAYAFVATLASNHTVAFSNATGFGATAIEPLGRDSELAPDGLVTARGDSLLFVHYFLSREVVAYDLTYLRESNSIERVARIPVVAKERLPAAVLRGKRVFYNATDPRMARDRYISCAVCHLDGSTDGRVWDFTHKGEGLRRTTSLLGRGGMAHGPVHWSGNFDEIHDFEHDIRDAFGGTGLMRDEDFTGARATPLGEAKAGLSPDLDDLAAYVSSLARVNPSPYRNPDGSMTPEALAGEALFNSPQTRCAECHVPPLYTDSRLGGGPGLPLAGFPLHDVGTLKPGSGKRLNDTLRGLDTPTLLGVWEEGSYLHDGSAATLKEVLTTANPADRHGKTSHLTSTQVDQLVAFLLQLDQSGEPARVAPRAGASGGLAAAPRVLRTPGGYRITWSAPAASRDFALDVLDARGRRIAALRPRGSRLDAADPSEATLSAKEATFYWEGPQARPGVYVLRMTWNGGAAARRVLLTR